MKRFISILLCVIMLFALALPVSAAAAVTVSLRIEGLSENWGYYPSVRITAAQEVTAADVVGAADMVVLSAGRVQSVNGVENGIFGGNEGWRVLVGNAVYTDNLYNVKVGGGENVVVFYGNDDTLVPSVDLSDMMSQGIVRFVSRTAYVHNGISTSVEFPISGAVVTWDGMEYFTDAEGEIIIDSTGLGVPHTVQIERYTSDGMPTVVRFEPEYIVSSGFTDVAETDDCYGAVMYAVNRGLFNGTSAATFSPEMAMNRAMFVTVLGRLAGIEVDHDAATSFNDINYDGWSVGYINWAYSIGVINGIGNGAFGQYVPLTREQLVTMLFRYAEKCGADVSSRTSLGNYTDGSSVSSYAADAIEWAICNEIIGVGTSRLRPTENASRADVAQMLMQFEKVMLNVSFL